MATACTGCRRTSLIVQTHAPELSCPRCGADSVRVPGALYTPRDLQLFTQLEDVVQQAELSSRGAAFIAAELETVGLRWEPPELALERVARRLPGLHRVYSPQQDYGQLLLAVSMLLTIVCARLQNPGPPRSIRHSESGLHRKYSGEIRGQTLTAKKSG
jgi:hypothetical protein